MPSLLSQRKSFPKNEINRETSRAKRYLITAKKHLELTKPEGRIPRLFYIRQQIPLRLNQLELGFWFLRPKDLWLINQRWEVGGWAVRASLFSCVSCVPINVSLFFFFFLRFKNSFFKYIYFIVFLNFTILYWFCHTSTWICHRYTLGPHPAPSSLLPPHTIPLGRPIFIYQLKSQYHRNLSFFIMKILSISKGGWICLIVHNKGQYNGRA